MLESITQLLQSSVDKDRFCTSITVPSSGLTFSVTGVGKIDKPITESIAKAMIKEARLASFGWKDQTVVDTRVRNVWEIPKSKVKFSKRDFHEIFSPKLEIIRHDLGLSDEGELTAELHNLVIYEPGQFFTSHQDSEKSENMIGTMVVLLPSPFEGGSLIVEQHGNKKTFLGPKELNNLNIVAFYADCQHEVKKVTSGFRVALTFNLIFEVKGDLALVQENPSLTASIRQYFNEKPADKVTYRREHPRWLVYLLDHEYSQKGLAWKFLKGSDRIRVAQLRSTAEKLGLNINLALAELHQTWEAEEEYTEGNRRRRSYSHFGDRYDNDQDDEMRSSADEVRLGSIIDEDYSLAHWIDADGAKMNLREHSTPKEMFCWTKAIDEFKPFKSEHEGYMGNYGNTMDHWYHRAAVVLWPKEMEYSSRFAIDPVSTLSKLKNVIKKDNIFGREILNQVLPQWERLSSADSAESADLLEIASLVEDRDLAERLLLILNLEAACDKNASHLASLTRLYGEPWLVNLLNHWSKAGHMRSKKISDLSEVVCNFSGLDTVVNWLLLYQLEVLVSSDNINEKNNGKVELERDRKVSVEFAGEYLQAAHKSGFSEYSKIFVEHVLCHARVYSNLALAELAAELEKSKSIESEWLIIKEAALTRISKELSHEREKGDFSIEDEIPCNCSDCVELTRFLRSKTKIETVIPLAKDRRQHIHNIIDGMGFGVSHITQRTGSPYKLVLKKLNDHFKNEATYRKKLREYLLLIKHL